MPLHLLEFVFLPGAIFSLLKKSPGFVASLRHLAKMSHGPYKKTPSYGEYADLSVAESQIRESYGGQDPARLADENCDIATAEELALGVHGCRRKSDDSRVSFEPGFCSENSSQEDPGKTRPSAG
jgi:hypothetical protein